MKKLCLIDGSGFIFRAYHSLPPLTRSDGTPVGAVYGFINMINKLVEANQCDHIAVIFDAGRQTFRNRLYPEYKAHRPPPPEDLIPQFPLVREASIALGLPALELVDYEADDLIATYTKEARKQGMEVLIVSSDKDLMQLIEDGVSMYDGMKQKTIGRDQVIEKFGVPPDKVRDVLSLIGDSSDNVPGVPGIGPKTAAELIGQFGDLDSILARASEIKQNKRRESILANIEQAKLSRDLITLCETCPLPMPIEKLVINTDRDILIPFLQLNGFKSLTAKYESKLGGSATATSIPAAKEIARPTITPSFAPTASEAVTSQPFDFSKYTLVQDIATLKQWIEKAHSSGRVAFDTETTSLDAMRAELVGFSLCLSDNEACYVPLQHVTEVETQSASQASLFDAPVKTTEKKLAPNQIPLEEALALLKPLLTSPYVLKIGQNIKYDMLLLKQRYNIDVTPFEDTMLLSYIYAAGRHAHNMDALSERYLGHIPISYDEVTGTGRARKSFAEVDLEKAKNYAAEDADITLRLADNLKPRLIAEHLIAPYETIERPLVPVLLRMEQRGVKVDREKLRLLSSDFATRMGVLEQRIHTLAGQEFNIGSPKQLGELLFDKLQLPGGKKSSKTGAYATDVAVLEELSEQGHEIPARVLDWRQLAKLKSTYTDTLAEQIHPQTGRVHTSYAMAIASTGRLSSTDPNLQNIPIRTEEGKKIREAFVAEEGLELISADYSQIELRLLAHVADIGTLKNAFRNGDDIHAITASQMFGVPVKEVGSDLRRSAKTINFGIIYGISAHGLATRLGISRTEAANYIEKYFEQYPGIREYMETTKAFARANGYVQTLYGRRCHLPDINSKNGGMRSFSERAAINAPLQGTAADIIKRAMIAIDRRIEEGNEPVKMLLQVHDELVFESPLGTGKAASEWISGMMQSAASLSVPLTVESGVGQHWGAIH